MGFFDKLDKLIEKAEKFVDETFQDKNNSNKTVYCEETLINLCKNDRRILYDDFLRKAQVISNKTVEFFWNMERLGTNTIKKVSDEVYVVTINGTVSGLDDFGNITDTFIYTKTIYIDKYGDFNNTIGSSNIIVKKKL